MPPRIVASFGGTVIRRSRAPCTWCACLPAAAARGPRGSPGHHVANAAVPAALDLRCRCALLYTIRIICLPTPKHVRWRADTAPSARTTRSPPPKRRGSRFTSLMPTRHEASRSGAPQCPLRRTTPTAGQVSPPPCPRPCRRCIDDLVVACPRRSPPEGAPSRGGLAFPCLRAARAVSPSVARVRSL